jgi:hypothetical protein
MLGKKLNCVHDPCSVGGYHPDPVTSVMVRGRPNVPSVFTMWRQCASGFWFYMCYRSGSGGANGVLLKSNWLKSWVADEIVGLMRDVRNRLRVNVACGNSSHHRCIGNCLLTEHSPTTKWFLNVWMARSDAFCPWRCVGTSCRSMCSSVRYCRNALEHSLSITCISGLRPALMSCLCNEVYAHTISLSVLFFIGSVEIVLLS